MNYINMSTNPNENMRINHVVLGFNVNSAQISTVKVMDDLKNILFHICTFQT